MALSAAGGATLLTACDLSTAPKKEGGEQQSRSNGPEAPMLARLVKDGKLPPVEERLPDNPRVIEPVEQIGWYGGTWNSLEIGNVDSWFDLTVGYEHLVSWDPNYEEVIPNIVESFEILGEGREYVFTLRKGMKWSDGEPYTADDLVFWYEAVLLNKEITPLSIRNCRPTATR